MGRPVPQEDDGHLNAQRGVRREAAAEGEGTSEDLKGQEKVVLHRLPKTVLLRHQIGQY